MRYPGRQPESLPPVSASLYDVRQFCELNEVRVAFDYSTLEEEYYSEKANIYRCEMTHNTDYRQVYAPWYRLGNQPVPYDHWRGRPWSFAELGDSRRPLPDEHRARIEAMRGNVPPERLRVLTLAIGKRKLVLDGNHRLVDYLREGDPRKSVYEICIAAAPRTRIVPDTWSWYEPTIGLQRAGQLASLGVLAAATYASVDTFIFGDTSGSATAANVSLFAISRVLAHWPQLTARLSQRMKGTSEA